MSLSTCLVTVTYADRIGFLEKLLSRVFFEQDVGSAIIVSNASVSPLETLEQRWPGLVTVIHLPSNIGSAGGYAVGIKAGLDSGAARLLLMDDDNAPVKGSVARLESALDELSAKVGPDRAMVTGFRPTHQPDIAAGKPASKAYPPPSSILGFHLAQLPQKVWGRVRDKTPAKVASGSRGQGIQIPFAPYGGTMGDRRVFESLGQPKVEFLVYADDTEYTLRLTQKGGIINLVLDAPIEDLEMSWNVKSAQANAFLVLLNEGSGFRTYYSTRNRAWVDSHVRCLHPAMYTLNRFVFLAVLQYFARSAAQKQRYELIRRAIVDGETGALGPHRDYPLHSAA